jgi:hypothetical protein
MGTNETTDHQVVFERPAMRGPKQQPPAPYVWRLVWFNHLPAVI